MSALGSRVLARVAVVAALAAAVVVGASSGGAVAQPGGFGDVPDGAFYSVAVSALAERGVFDGTHCEEGFCPGGLIDRKTMAVWTVRLLDGGDPPAVQGTRFDDVDPDGFHAAFIERMAVSGVTTGCGDGSGFCPDRNVTRAHMAVFLSRAYDLPDAADPGFGDVPDGAWYAADVARLAASGITTGCGDGSGFCPGRGTTRAEMATFLYRAENRAETEEESDSADDAEVTGGGGGGGFGDVPDGAFYSVAVSALAERGVFDGTHCEEGFCPGGLIDRKTMAVWTVRLLDGGDPPAVQGTPVRRCGPRRLPRGLHRAHGRVGCHHRMRRRFGVLPRSQCDPGPYGGVLVAGLRPARRCGPGFRRRS